MKRFVILLAALVLLAARAEAKNELLYPIALGNFENHSAYAGPLDLSGTFRTALSELFQGTDLFFVVPESELADKTALAGGVTPAQLLLRGEITSFTDGQPAPGATRAEFTAVISLVDVATGQVKAVKNLVSRARIVGASPGFSDPAIHDNLAAFRKTNAGQALTAATEDVLGFCVAQLVGLPWSGSVILVKGSQIYFNRGQREGVIAGQVFRVGTTEVVRDPGTGEILDNRFTEKAQIRVDSVKERAATCSLIIGTGIERGMVVRPKE